MNPIQPALMMLTVGLTFDFLFGEPPESLHPVVWIGRLIRGMERRARRSLDLKWIGLGFVFFIPLLFGSCGYFFYLIVHGFWPVGGWLVGGFLLKISLSPHALFEESKQIAATLEEKPEKARQRLKNLVGRDRSDLSIGEMRSAIIESLFENLVDSFLTPLFFYIIGLPVGPGVGLGLALVYKGVNTLDSMIGYRAGKLAELGYFSAKADDALNYVPARLSALLISIVGLSNKGIKTALRFHRFPPSPNGGWPMSAAAGALEVQLKKPGVYALLPEQELPGKGSVTRALDLARRVVFLAAALAVLTTVVLGL